MRDEAILPRVDVTRTPRRWPPQAYGAVRLAVDEQAAATRVARPAWIRVGHLIDGAGARGDPGNFTLRDTTQTDWRQD